MLKVYLYKNCSTCRDAKKWLQARGIEFEEKAIRETPPAVGELGAVADAVGLQKLFNTSGGDYRELGLKDKLPTMSRDEAFALLASNGNLVKRPFVVGEGVALTGFKAADWEKALA
ncbi:Spx/MgsR family RNA polymerase-binding regulatory protein [Luteolibacter sp. LG18]|uniref:Spx/MgsR family RNA polymerase-binding regulatory protein n=1 Tax=Luteolibacter sp. LG18 TaxID=2819286 RepID=UPI002B30304C|nr:ArsC family transcriptional regulator [Luteolibacter sp. LG18]